MLPIAIVEVDQVRINYLYSDISKRYSIKGSNCRGFKKKNLSCETKGKGKDTTKLDLLLKLE